MNEQPPFHLAVDLLQTAPPSWREVLSGLLTPVIAIFTVYIAYQQHRLTRVKFRHESYGCVATSVPTLPIEQA